MSEKVFTFVNVLRLGDPDGNWVFEGGDGYFDAWFNARLEVLHEISRHAGETNFSAPPAEILATVELSTLSSDLALDLLGGAGLGEPERFALAVVNLSEITALLPPAGRAGFLFQCWQHWAAPLTSVDRRQLISRATGDAVRLLDAVGDRQWPATHITAWERYADALRLTAGAGVAPYLLLDHAHRTHRRIGIDAATEALAAQTLRTVLEAGLAVPALRAATLQMT
ncbi:hypothetical protein AB0F72_37090 [Actinoplanes sp. NPDC023936]|uniref:hypothetical protein n=1 Tax=Actinoplanes sp. NPDC023936 TaxID=3154910 RepID=UPI0033C20768